MPNAQCPRYNSRLKPIGSDWGCFSPELDSIIHPLSSVRTPSQIARLPEARLAQLPASQTSPVTRNPD